MMSCIYNPYPHVFTRMIPLLFGKAINCLAQSSLEDQSNEDGIFKPRADGEELVDFLRSLEPFFSRRASSITSVFQLKRYLIPQGLRLPHQEFEFAMPKAEQVIVDEVSKEESVFNIIVKARKNQRTVFLAGQPAPLVVLFLGRFRCTPQYDDANEWWSSYFLF